MNAWQNKSKSKEGRDKEGEEGTWQYLLLLKTFTRSLSRMAEGVQKTGLDGREKPCAQEQGGVIALSDYFESSSKDEPKKGYLLNRASIIKEINLKEEKFLEPAHFLYS